MKKNNIKDKITFSELEWDTQYFGVSSAKAILYKPLTLNEWRQLKVELNKYEFVSIENRSSEPINAQLIGKYSSAFLADVNIQFLIHLEESHEMPNTINIHQSLENNEQIISMAEFPYSKFEEDSQLLKRGGEEVYRQWLINSFGKEDKFYALSRNEKNNINGFLLHSYVDNACLIELIAVSKKAAKAGIGSNLIKAVKSSALQKGISKIKVGTQVRNINAINFYQKVGFRQVDCHQIYHLWNNN